MLQFVDFSPQFRTQPRLIINRLKFPSTTTIIPQKGDDTSAGMEFTSHSISFICSERRIHLSREDKSTKQHDKIRNEKKRSQFEPFP